MTSEARDSFVIEETNNRPSEVSFEREGKPVEEVEEDVLKRQEKLNKRGIWITMICFAFIVVYYIYCMSICLMT